MMSFLPLSLRPLSRMESGGGKDILREYSALAWLFHASDLFGGWSMGGIRKGFGVIRTGVLAHFVTSLFHVSQT